jgi:hypothetical protein
MNSSSIHGLFDAIRLASLTCRSLCAFLQLLCVGEQSQVSESGSCKEVSAGPDIQSHRVPTRAVDEMRLGLRRSPYGAQYAAVV